MYTKPETVYMKAENAYINRRPPVIPETDTATDHDYYILDPEKLEADESGSSAGYATVGEMQTNDQKVEQVTGNSVSTESQYSYARVYPIKQERNVSSQTHVEHVEMERPGKEQTQEVRNIWPQEFLGYLIYLGIFRELNTLT